MTKRRPISQLPSIHRTSALERFFGSTVDHLFQPGKAEPVSGYIGRVPSYFDPSKDFYKKEPTLTRAKYQLEAAMASEVDGNLVTALFYDDLISRLGAAGAITSDPHRLLQTEFWSWSPPVDIDKLNNFQHYYWSGDDVPTLELTLPGIEMPAFYHGTGSTRRFKMPRALPCWRILPEDQITITVGDVGIVLDASPAVLVNGALATIALIDGDDIVLADEPDINDVVEVFRYGNISDGVRTDFAFPELFNDTLAFDIDDDIHVYVNGRETLAFTRIDTVRIRLNVPAPANSFVTVTAWNSIEQLCTGQVAFDISKLNSNGVAQMINGLKIKLIDPWVFFLGFGVKSNDTFKWDESRANIFYVEGVGISIHLVDATIFAGLEPQYIGMSRSDPAYSYWSKINRWVLGDALDWFNGRLASRQARRPICEYVSGLRLWNYGITRAPDVDAMFGVLQNRTFPDLSIDLTGDNGRVIAAGEVVLFGNIGNPSYDHKFVIWPAIDDLTIIDDIVLQVIHTAVAGDIVAYATSAPDEYKFNGSEWTMVEQHGEFPLFDLYDNNGVSLGDLGEYPDTTFDGSRIFCYQVGTGDVDNYLGFAVKHDTYGQIMFENDLYTKSYSYRDGEIIGFYYYLVRDNAQNKFYNEWYKAEGLLPAAGSAPDIVVPLNLQANPNFDTPKFISRNNWFAHFASIVANQENATGQAYSENNWVSTSRDLSKGSSIVQSRAPLLKLMLLMGENGFDLQRSIAFAEREYSRLKLKVAQKINEGLRDGTLTASFDPDATIKSILKKLVANKNADFAFFLSPVGGSNYFIPPTPAVLGIHSMVRPHMVVENGDSYIVGHDGSKVAGTDPIMDSALMALENLIFDSREATAYREELRPLIDEYDLISGKWREADYSLEETNAVHQAGFEDWARTNSLDYQNNVGFDEDNPFTWNYGSLTDRDGGVLPGNWRGIYRYYFDTETPNLTPWEMLGFAERPSWWIGLYGSAPYIRSNTAMWEAIAMGQIAQGPRAGIDARFARPNMMDVLPVDSGGNLLDPVAARIVERAPTIQLAQESWVFGDSGPVEALWRRSSSFGFAKAAAMFLMRPAQFVEYYWDTDMRALIHGDQWIDIPSNDRASHSELFIHGELINGVPKVSMGIQNWIVELMVQQGQSADTLGSVLRGLDVRLAHKMAGFTTPDRMTISAESFGLIPAEDITLSLYQSPGLSVDNYSGIIIEHLDTSRWRIIGYNATDPYFSVQPNDRGGKKIVLNPSSTDDRIVNPWGASIYYKVGMFVFFNGLVYEATKSHVSSSFFEPNFWEIDSQGFSNDEKLYRHVDGDGSIARIPYATVFRTRQDVIDFVYAYQRDLEQRGFAFPDNSWDDAAIKFINWSRVKWASGSFLTLSPAANTLEYTTQQGYILDLENPFVYNGVINRTGHVIDDRNTKVDRFDNQLSIVTTGTDEIYGVSLRRAEIEHIVIFSNRTIFGDIIFDPTFNVRQERLKMSARATTEWTGRYDAPGFIITDGQIVSNFEKSAEDIRHMFDIELADNTVLRDHARHVIGFEKRPYLANLLLNETQQFELYQGMIQQKGALGSLSKIMRSKAVEGNRDLKFMEEWAFKIAEFGAYEPRGYVEILLKQNDLRRQHQLIRFGSPLVSQWKTGSLYQVGNFVEFENIIYVARTNHTAIAFLADIVNGDWAIDVTEQASTTNAILNIADDDSRWVSKPLKFDDLVIENADGFYSLPDAGYIRSNEADFSAPDFDKFEEDAKLLLRNGAEFSAGQSVWIYQRDFNGWSAEYIDYPTEDFSSANLVHENFSQSGEWRSSLVGVPETTSVFSYGGENTPDVIPTARYVAFVDGNGTVAQAGTYLYSKIIDGITPDAIHIFGLAAQVTEGFNGSIHIQVSWTKEDDTPTALNSVSTIGLVDYRITEAREHTYHQILDSLIAPVDATKAILRISVEFGTVVDSAGRVYIGNPELRYGDLGVRVITTNTADTNSDVTGARFILNRPHNFEVGDFVLIGGPIQNNFTAVGSFEIINTDTDWFEIDVDLQVNGVQAFDYTETDELGPPVYRLNRGRFANKASAQLQPRLNGNLVYIDDSGENRWAVYRAPDFTNALRQQPDMVDSSKIASTLIFDKQTKITQQTIQPEPITLARINPVDPMTGILIGVADREVDYKLEYDPAGYTEEDGLWTDNYVGRVWWDMSTTWFINPYTDILPEDNTDRYLAEIQYRSANWAKLAPGVTINLYEWTKARIAPEEVDGEPPIDYVISNEFDSALGREVSVYYFWAKNPNTIPDVSFRKLDCKSCAAILANPSLAGVPWMAIISNKEMIYSGVREYLNDGSTVAQTLLQLTDWEEDVSHVQWMLIRPDDPRSQPPTAMWDKLITSLVGFDENLKSIPAKNLHDNARTGIAHGQSMFDVEKNSLARESLITMLNYQLARRNFGSDPTFGAEWLTFISEPIENLSWTKLDGQSPFSLLPPKNFYDELTTDPAVLTEIFAAISTPVGHRVLLDNRFSDNPSWSVWEKQTGVDVVVAKAYDTTVANRGGLGALTLLDGARVLVESDSDFEGFWTINQYDATNDSFTVVWAQTYNTTDFWEYSDWYADNYDATIPPVVAYATINERNQSEAPVSNLLVKILDNGAGYWVWTAYINGSWETVAQQGGTIQLNSKLFTNTVEHGWSYETEDYAFNGGDVRLRRGSYELRILFNALINKPILTMAEKNELWFSMVNFIHAHHDQVDWAFKTSFLTVVGYNEALLASPVTSPDTTKDILKYVDEVKPYHVTVRDFSRSFAANDQTNIVATDFDKPLYYDEANLQYRTLNHNVPADNAIMQNGVWQYWLENMDKARRFRMTMKIDRVWFEDTGPSSGAASRIMAFYNPTPDMKPKNLSTLLGLDFKGTILDGMSFVDDPEETTIATGDGSLEGVNGIQDDLTEGFQMRDPRVAENTPEELVRLGAHDIFLLRAHDKWGAGAPMGTINTYDVERESLDIISLRVDALARDVVVFFDGVRVIENRDYIFNQFENQIKNVLLQKLDGSRVKTVTIHAFGYAGHASILDQTLVSAEQTGILQIDVPQWIVDDGMAYSHEVTNNGKLLPSTLTSGVVSCSVITNGQIVVTFYKTANPDTTRIVSTRLPTTVNPIGTNDVVGIPERVIDMAGYTDPYIFFDMANKRSFVGDQDVSSLNVNSLSTLAPIASGTVDMLSGFEGSDLIVTRDRSTLSYSIETERKAEDLIPVSRFDPRFWTVNFPRPMMASVVTTGSDSLRADAVFYKGNDLAGLIWASEDTLDHPLLSYETNRDYRNMTVSFRWESSGIMPLDSINGPTLTISGRDANGQPKSWYVRLWNYAVGTNQDAQITLDFDNLAGGFILPQEADPVFAGDIDQMFISLVPPTYDTTPTSFVGAQNGWVELSEILCVGDGIMLDIGNTMLPAHSFKMATGYDDSYNQTPARLLRQIQALGYRGTINHYVGMSHYFRLEPLGGGHYVSLTGGALNVPCSAWHTNFAAQAKLLGFDLIISLSYELFDEHCWNDWKQRAENGDPALTGWVPPSTLLSPAHSGAMGYLQAVARAFVYILKVAVLPVKFQVGEPWWWIMPDGRICLYDAAATATLGALSVSIPNIAGSKTAQQNAMLDKAGEMLASSTAALVAAAQDEAGVIAFTSHLLVYLPTVLDPLAPEAKRANVPVDWASPAFDVLQLEDYDWVTSGNHAATEIGIPAMFERLGYPIAEQHYFSGFVLNHEDVSQWGDIVLAAEYSIARGTAHTYIWALPQVARDGFTYYDGAAHRALQIRNINNLNDVLVNIGTNGIYAAAPALTQTTIPETADVFAFHNTATGSKVILVIFGTQSLVFDDSGAFLKSLGDLTWTSGQSFAAQASDSAEYLTVLLVNPASVTKPVYRLQIGQYTDVIASLITINELVAMGTMSIKSSVYNPTDNTMIFFANRAEGGDLIFKYNLSGGFIMWTEWSGHNGELDRFSLPRNTSSSQLSEGFHFVWAADNNLLDLDPRDGTITTIGALANAGANGKQSWNEYEGMLVAYLNGSTELTRVIVSFADSGFESAFSLNELSLRKPYMSSMIVEVNGHRLSPPRMIHLSNLTDYFLGDRVDPSKIRILDDTGFFSVPVIYTDDAFETIDDIYSAGLSARVVYWKQNIVLLDADALVRDYTMIVRDTGEFTIDDNTGILTIFSLHSTDVVRVIHWRNDYIMEPTSWSFNARSSGIYRINTRARQGKSWVTINGLRLVEDVDYSMLPTFAGAWDIESFDTFRYDDVAEVDITIKNTMKGHENDLVVITTFEGPEATPPLDWQTDTTTPSIYRFKKIADEYIEDGAGEYIREPLAWEVSTSDLLREGGKLETAISETEDIETFTISINPLNAPTVIQNTQPVPVPDRGANVPGVIWIGEERIEYFDRVLAGDNVIFMEIRRGTRGTPKTIHAVGELVTVQNIKRRIPRLPHGDIPLPPSNSGPDNYDPDEPIYPLGALQRTISFDSDIAILINPPMVVSASIVISSHIIAQNI